MTLLLDTSLWIDFTRTRGPVAPSSASLPTCLTLLPTPADLWQQAINLGQACRTVLCLDLLIAAVAPDHNAQQVSFDADFETIASVSALRLNRLRRPG